MEHSAFVDLLGRQIRNEFTASQQYIAAAVWFDEQDLPRLAAHFYRQSVEERNHAMMMVRYLLDRDLPAPIPGVDDVHQDFKTPIEPLQLALAQEQAVTGQIEALFKAAREANDVLGEQFMLWFLKEQVEEVASMATLVTIAERAGDDWFRIEEHLTRETVGDAGIDPSAPEAAGGALSARRATSPVRKSSTASAAAPALPLRPWSPVTGTSVTRRRWAAGNVARAARSSPGEPKVSRSPWTTRTGTGAATAAASSSKRDRSGRPGGCNGKASATTPAAPSGPASRQATRAPALRPPNTNGSGRRPRPAESPATTAVQPTSSWGGGVATRRPETRQGCSTRPTAQPAADARLATACRSAAPIPPLAP